MHLIFYVSTENILPPGWLLCGPNLNFSSLLEVEEKVEI